MWLWIATRRDRRRRPRRSRSGPIAPPQRDLRSWAAVTGRPGSDGRAVQHAVEDPARDVRHEVAQLVVARWIRWPKSSVMHDPALGRGGVVDEQFGAAAVALSTEGGDVLQTGLVPHDAPLEIDPPLGRPPRG